MSEPIDLTLHRRLAVELFNHVWTLLGKGDRTEVQRDEMIHAAHASRYHWQIAGTAQHWSIGEWQISRVYAVVNRVEAALFHAERARNHAIEEGVEAFCLAYAYEAEARAYAVAGDVVAFDRALAAAKLAGERVADAEDREQFEKDLGTLVRPV